MKRFIGQRGRLKRSFMFNKHKLFADFCKKNLQYIFRKNKLICGKKEEGMYEE